MRGMNRRDFMRQATGMLTAAAVAGQGSAALGEGEKLTATTMRTLGKTGVQCTLLGMGTGVKAWNGQSALTRKGRDTCLAVMKHAYERGIRYFDLADMYGSHDFLRELLVQGPMERDKVTLLTKTNATEPAAAKTDLERFRKELDTDRLDVVLMHCMQRGDWLETMQECMDVMEEAKQKGVVRAHGVSCHGLEALARAADSPWVDVVLARINPFGVKMDGPPEKVVPLLRRARENGKGILGMKIVGEGQLRDRLAESIRYVLGLGLVDAMPIGFLDPSEVDSAIAHIEAVG